MQQEKNVIKRTQEVNHKKLAETTEKKATIEMSFFNIDFKKSIQLGGSKHIPYVWDGDLSSFGLVQDTPSLACLRYC